MIILAGENYIHKRIWFYVRTVFKENKNIVVIDGANKFDPYLIAKISLSIGINPYEILEKIFIARAFTPFQLQQLLKKVYKQSIKRKSFLFICLGLTNLLDDDNISKAESHKVLGRALFYLSNINNPIITINKSDRRNFNVLIKKFSNIYIEDHKIIKPDFLMKKGGYKLWVGQLHHLHTH